MANGDLYTLIDVQTLDGQEVLNVYTYRQQATFVSTVSDAQTLAQNWIAQKLPDVLAVQSAELAHVALEVKNLYNSGDFYNAVVTASGAYSTTQDTLPAFNAFGIKFDNDDSAIRPGSKRIAGVNEGCQEDGVIVDPTYITDLLTLCDALSSAVTVGLIIPDPVFFPVTVKRVRSGSPGSYEYRFPENVGETVLAQITDAVFNFLLTSQVSRKIGVGV